MALGTLKVECGQRSGMWQQYDPAAAQGLWTPVHVISIQAAPTKQSNLSNYSCLLSCLQKKDDVVATLGTAGQGLKMLQHGAKVKVLTTASTLGTM